jgi:hypothetical protein
MPVWRKTPDNPIERQMRQELAQIIYIMENHGPQELRIAPKWCRRCRKYHGWYLPGIA